VTNCNRVQPVLACANHATVFTIRAPAAWFVNERTEPRNDVSLFVAADRAFTGRRLHRVAAVMQGHSAAGSDACALPCERVPSHKKEPRHGRGR
jgi:hypothetical protein